MKIEQRRFVSGKWEAPVGPNVGATAQLVLAFGSRALVEDESAYKQLAEWYPAANIILGSTSGEIFDTTVADDTLSVAAIFFEKTTVVVGKTTIENYEESREVGRRLAGTLPQEGLTHVLVFSEGLKVNGTQLVAGLGEGLPKNVSVTGGLVGDAERFKETAVGLDGPAQSGIVVAVGLYGSALKVGYGSLGGWDPFGIERIITKSKGNILYELDGRPALELYKEYLGEQAKDPPGSGILFPLSIEVRTGGKEANVVRAVLSINEADQSMNFAGDVPEGVPAQLMKANFERIIEGAEKAASMSIESIGSGQAELALLVSCIGRKMVLRERTEEELEAVRNVVGPQAVITGFYSYGELCPTAATEKQCQLHNQTMTITTLREE